MNEEDKKKLVDMVRTKNTNKGWITRAVGNADTALDLYYRGQTEILRKELGLAVSKCEERLEIVQKSLQELAEFNPDAAETYSAEQSVYEKSVDDLITRVAETKLKVSKEIGTNATSNTPTLAAAAGSGVVFTHKVNSTLKPDPPLQCDDSPARLRQFKKEFVVYYSSSNMDKATLKEQQAYLRRCLSSELNLRIEDKIKETMPVFSDDKEIDSCFSCLESEFKVLCPPAKRRNDFYCAVQSQGQKASEFFAKVNELAREADLTQMEPEDHIIFKTLQGMRCRDLKEKLLEEQDLTVDRMKAKIDSHESTQSVMEAAKQPHPQVSVNKADSLSCFICGKGHLKKNCTFSPDVDCFKCGNKGHMSTSPLCPKKSDDRRTSPSKQKDYRKRFTQASGAKQASDDGGVINTEEPRPGDASVGMARLMVAQRRSREPEVRRNKRHGRGRRNSGRSLPVCPKDLELSCRLTEHETAVERRGAVPTSHVSKSRMAVAIVSEGTAAVTRMALADTGADVDFISKDWADAQGLALDEEDAVSIAGADNRPLKVEGSARVTLEYQGQSVRTTMYVSSSMKQEFLVSCATLQRLRVIPAGFPNVMPSSSCDEAFMWQEEQRENAAPEWQKAQEMQAGGKLLAVRSASNSPEPLEYNLVEWADAARNDAAYQLAVTAFKNGKGPDSLGQDHPCQVYRSVWGNFTSFDHPFYPDRPLLVYDRNRLVVPATCKRRILGILHRNRGGFDRVLGVAQRLYYWPGMVEDIRAASTHVEECDVCRKYFRLQDRIFRQQNRRSGQVTCRGFLSLPFRSDLAVGTPVWVTRPQANVLDDVRGVVQEVFQEGRRYRIKLASGQEYYRNSKYVRPISE